jgi:hypothetical protein
MYANKQWINNVLFVVGAFVAGSPSAALSQERPAIERWSSPTPGTLVVEWRHRDDGADEYVVEIKGVRGYFHAAKEARSREIRGLPSSRLQARVCAVFMTHMECSHNDDAPWMAMTAGETSAENMAKR